MCIEEFVLIFTVFFNKWFLFFSKLQSFSMGDGFTWLPVANDVKVQHSAWEVMTVMKKSLFMLVVTHLICFWFQKFRVFLAYDQ